MSIPTGSMTEIINLAALPGAGTFVSSSVRYARISNLSTGSVNLQLSGSTDQFNFLLRGSGSFIFNSEYVSGQFNNFTYGDLRSVKASPVDSEATIGYLVVTT
jgi:hypothetical protein